MATLFQVHSPDRNISYGWTCNTVLVIYLYLLSYKMLSPAHLHNQLLVMPKSEFFFQCYVFVFIPKTPVELHTMDYLSIPDLLHSYWNSSMPI